MLGWLMLVGRSAPQRWAPLLFGLGLVSNQAQVVTDGTLGSTGALEGPNYSITADLGLTQGNNLFHSFAQFDLKAGDIASFSGPAHIQNILSRVTGDAASSIDGTLRSEIAGANFFFINPHGVVFGPNAAMDVSGSFAASTADYLELTDGARFFAALDADDSLLSTAPVAAFGFLEGASGSLEVRGSVTTGPDSALSLVGSTVSATDGARLESPRGSIDLVGVTAPGRVPFPPSPPPASPVDLGPGTEPSGSGNVVIRGGRLMVENALITASQLGGDIDIELSEGLEVTRGGQITSGSSGPIHGGNIAIDSPSVVLDGIDGSRPTRIAAETFSHDPNAGGGDITVTADTVDVRRGAEVSVSSFGTADAGRLEITASSLRLEGSEETPFPTQISANASSAIGAESGQGGEIVLRAQSIEISDFAGILAATTGDANAGTVDVSAGSLTLANGAITTFTAGAGAGGAIRIQTDELTLDGPFASITAMTTGLDTLRPAGDGGVIEITAGQFQLLNDSAISANTFGDGTGGNIVIRAESALLDTATFQQGSIPGITAASNPPFFGDANGQGGNISLTTGALTLRNGMVISTTTSTAGDGGSITITADSLSMDSQSSIQSASEDIGRAGSLSLQIAHDALLNGHSSISTSAPESSGGNIVLAAGEEIRLTDSEITAQAGPGGGGSITVMAPALIYLLDSTFTAQAVGDGGNLTIDPVFFILNRSSLISKSTSANGGNITILSDYFFQSSSLIDASAPFGLPGTVEVSAPQVDLSGSLIGLPSSLLDIESQLRPDCAVRLTAEVSSFVVLGRGGLPMIPGGFVPSTVLPPLRDETD